MRAKASSAAAWSGQGFSNHKKPHCECQRRKGRHDVLRLERLEERLLFTLAPDGGSDPWGLMSGHAGVCSCPVCTGVGLDQIPTAEIDTSGIAEAPLSSLPQLHSNSSATAKLFLDFDGHFESSWGGYSNVNTPAFDLDGDVTTFSSGELSAIYEVWARIAEDYAPFNIDVTTVDPGNQANRVVAVIAIGGSNSDWYGSSAGGVAYVGGFFNSSSNVGYVFENNLSSNSKYIAEAASHEAGHLFGLQHQALWSGSTLVNPYHPGNSAWAPLMGVGYNAARTTWHNGPTAFGPTAYQDDMAILAGANNAFGYKADDFGSATSSASSLPTTGTSVNFSGLIGQASDQDVWSFTTTGGTVTFQLTGAQYGSNLDAVLELWNSSGTSILSDAPSGSLGASLTTSLAAGTYYLVARSLGDYGDVGQYTITGSLPSASASPEIHLSVSGTGVADGGTINFGSTTAGTSVTRTVTVTNTGSAVLTLSPLNAGALPTGFTLVSNLGATSLSAGQSTTFVVRLNATAAGSFSGVIQLASDDSDENPYDLTLSGTVMAPEIDIAISGAGVADGQTVVFGSTLQGQSVTRLFTVTNTGNATLTLSSLNAGSLPAGFTLVSNLGSTTLAAGQSTTFSIRLDATAAGSYSGVIQLVNNDSNENPYDIGLTGSVSAPEIVISLAGNELSSGQSVAFGTTTQGLAVTRNFTVTNTGNATLNLTPLNTGNLPAGFTLISNLSTTTLAGGLSTNFTVRLNATAAGSFGGTIQLVSNDADENPFSLVLSGTVQAPEIKVTLGGGDVITGQLIDFGNALVGATISRTFTVVNEGTSTLTLTAIDPASLPAGFVLTANLGATSLAAGQSTTFTIEFNAPAAGTFGGSITVANSDSDESSFVLQLQAIGSVPAPARASVLVAGQELTAGATVDFGSTVTGYTLERTFWIRNDGETALTVSSLDPASLPPGFSLLTALANTSLAPGETTSFILRLDAQSAGSYGGQVSLATSDAGGPFALQVSGSVADPIPPLSQVIDNGDSGTSLSGSWQRTTGKGYSNDIHTANKGNGSATYSWNFGSLPAGQYRVFVTYAAASGNASNAPFAVFDGGTKLTTVAVNQRTTPSGNSLNGKSWRLLTTATVNSGQLTVRLSNAANGKVVADAVRIERVISLVPPAAEISVSCDGGSDLTSDGSTISFGVLDLGVGQTHTFTVVNQGAGSLTLTPLDPASLPAGFSLVQALGSTYLTPGESTTFTLSLDADTVGTFSGTVSLLNTDGSESPFRFQVSGTVYDPDAPLTQTIDDGSTGNSRVGTWTRDATRGFSGDQWRANAGTGSIHSTWNFTNLPNGQYRVQATWRNLSTNATNAPFLLHNGSQLVSTVRVNERVNPNDEWVGGWWENLGTVTVTGNRLMVKLTNAANGSVVADAIRIERIVSADAALLTESPVSDSGADGNAAATWPMTFFVSSHHQTAVNLLPPGPTAGHLALASDSGVLEAIGVPHGAGVTDPEAELLADVLDLLAEARRPLEGQAQENDYSAHEIALSSVLQQLV